MTVVTIALSLLSIVISAASTVLALLARKRLNAARRQYEQPGLTISPPGKRLTEEEVAALSERITRAVRNPPPRRH